MDYLDRLAISYYKDVATINEEHHIYLVQHISNNKFYVKKILYVFNIEVYKTLQAKPIKGIPRIAELCMCEGHLIVIEEFISGYSVSELLEKNKITSKLITNIIVELCDILYELHALNPPVIHRDIKPSNIILTPYDHVVLIDFNAAKYYNEKAKADTILLGTEGYAAPEQYGFGASSPETDIYAIGILLRQLVSELKCDSSDYYPIIDRCTQLNKKDRFSSVKELKEALLGNSSHIKKSDFKRLLPPGFRTQTLWKMMVSAPIYAIIVYLSMTMDIKNATPKYLLCTRITCFFILISIVLLSNNYCNVQRLFPLCNSSNKMIRIAGIILLNVVTSFLVLIIMSIIVSV